MMMSEFIFLFEQKNSRNDAAYMVSIHKSEGNFLL